VPSIIVTLGTMMIARGVAQIITRGAQRNTSLPDVFGVIGSTSVAGTSIKVAVVIMIGLVIVAFIIEKMTVAGRRTYLIGANSVAAKLSGIKVGRHLTMLFIMSSLLAGITGILLASEFKAGMFVGAIILAVVTSSATGLLLSPDWQFTIKGIVTFVAILAQRLALDKRKG
jgi:ribose/xylose/arabinose/galactoside ABC-type transport system permease subunit